MNKEKFVEVIENYVGINRKLRLYVRKKYIKEMNEDYNADFAVDRWGIRDNNTEIWVNLYNLNYRNDEETITFNVDEFIDWMNKEDNK